jgi:phage head morphogenesis protein, SPP1 gp7 family
VKSSKYWQERFTQLEDATNKDAMKVYRDVDQAYQKAQAEIEAKINMWYQRFADNNSITMTEARKLLTSGELEEFKWTVEEYIKHGKDNAISGQWAKELENASARFHISRLEALKIQTQQSIEALYGNQLDTVDKAIKDMYSSRYYRTAFELQKGFGVGVVMDRLDNNTLSNIVNKPWAADGANFSSRVWSNKQKLVNELHSSLTRNIITGADPAKAIKEIKSKMGTSSYAAGRLIMTESAYFSSVAQKNVFSDLGVEKYEIIATLDSKTSEICRKLDGKVFDMKDFQAGVTAPPFHPYCRTTTAPYFDDWEELGIDRERVARNDKGDKYFVDGNMTYKDWEKQYVNKDAADDGKALDIDTQSGKVKVSEDIPELSKLKASRMEDDDYNEYFDIVNNHNNEDIRRLYKLYANEIDEIKLLGSKTAAYDPASNSLSFNYNSSSKYPEINKFGTLAHEYAHFFDEKAVFNNIHFKEVEAIRDATWMNNYFKSIPSSSDEFLEALRKDKEFLSSILTPELKLELKAHNASHGVQDAIDGLFPNARITWGHGERYYNQIYSNIEYFDKFARTSNKKALRQVYADKGFDVSNYGKFKIICRQYTAASEAWANIISAEVCGGKELEYVKKYLPNSYKAMLDILKGVN